MRMAAVAFVLLTMALGASASEDAKAWLSSPVEMNEALGIPIPVEDSCEVPKAKRGTAVSLLNKQTHIALSHAAAKSLVAGCINMAEGKTPYLVRAVYGHLGTGKYFVRRVGNDLLVAHGSLGRYSTFTKSALVVNLPFAPAHVFIKVSIDE